MSAGEERDERRGRRTVRQRPVDDDERRPRTDHVDRNRRPVGRADEGRRRHPARIGATPGPGSGADASRRPDQAAGADAGRLLLPAGLGGVAAMAEDHDDGGFGADPFDLVRERGIEEEVVAGAELDRVLSLPDAEPT